MTDDPHEAEPLDAAAAYHDSRSVPISEAWMLIEPAPVPQDRMKAVKSHFHDATLAVLAMPHPPRLGDVPTLLPWELVQRALDYPGVDLLLPTDEFVTGSGRRGGFHFIQCRAILSEHVASVQPAPGENEPVTLDGFARFFAALQTLPEMINAAKDELRAESGPETPPATIDVLEDILADLFVEDQAWEKAGDDRLSDAVISRDRRFRHHYGPPKHGCWSEGYLKQRIKDTRAEAKKDASYRRSGAPKI